MEEKGKNIEKELLEKRKKKKNQQVFLGLGKVVNKFGDSMFHVTLQSFRHRRLVLCYLSPRLRKNGIPVLIGDKVKIHRKKNSFKKYIFFRFAPDKRNRENAASNQD